MQDKSNTSKQERRCGSDRREGEISVLSKYRYTGKRKAVRRKEDRQGSYKVDRHSPKILVIILLIITFSILDAILTLYLIGKGATEINPIMHYFLEHGPLVFFLVKYFLTCASILIILVNANMILFKTRFRTKILLVLFVIPFAIVVHWEIFLILACNF